MNGTIYSRPLRVFHQQRVDNIYLPHRQFSVTGVFVTGVIDAFCEIDINIGSVTVFF